MKVRDYPLTGHFLSNHSLAPNKQTVLPSPPSQEMNFSVLNKRIQNDCNLHLGKECLWLGINLSHIWVCTESLSCNWGRQRLRGELPSFQGHRDDSDHGNCRLSVYICCREIRHCVAPFERTQELQKLFAVRSVHVIKQYLS